jgi:hypothetical protein
MRIAFLLVAAVGGCTPMAYDQRLPHDSPYAYQMAPRQGAEPPAQTKWVQSAPPAPAERADAAPPMLTATAGPNGAPGAVTAAKPAMQAPLPTTPLPAAGSPAPPKPAAAQVDQFLDKNLVQVSFNEKKTDKPGGFAERADADARAGALPPVPLPAAVAAAANNVVDLGPAPAAQPAFRMVNTKKFSLGFKVDDVGVTGVAGVDLWCTQDMRVWKKFDAVQQVNAVVVEVKDEGTYGFTLVARNGNGLGKAPPQPGDLPQVWVSVDTTPPAVTLSGVELNLTSKTPSLIVRWTAKDKNFGPRPVTLSFAPAAEGPWTLLAGNVENTGRYEWPLSSALPATMYVRVQAADLNGNVGMALTENPIRLDGYTVRADAAPEPARPAAAPTPAIDPARPSATILDVEPNEP